MRVRLRGRVRVRVGLSLSLGLSLARSWLTGKEACRSGVEADASSPAISASGANLFLRCPCTAGRRVCATTRSRMRSSKPGRPSTPYGYMREVQLHAYSQLVWHRPRVRTYCEVGFNGGHGTVAMLLASPRLQVHSFELGIFPYTRTAQDAR